MQFVELDWDTVEAAIKTLRHLGDFNEVNLVVGLEYGGIIPAALMHRFCHTASFTTIHPMMAGKEVFERILGHDHVLFVDDINDSGRTFKQVKKMMNLLFGATGTMQFACISLIKRKHTMADWATGGITVDHDDWFIFPWEDKKEEKLHQGER